MFSFYFIMIGENGMARKSKYSIEQSSSKTKLWNAALYIRLSREDGDKIESDSVVNQRDLLTSFVDELEDVCINDYYIDDGWSELTLNDQVS